MPSINQVMPWLHLVFEAWEDYKHTRKRSAKEERKAQKLAERYVANEEARNGKVADKDKERKRRRPRRRSNRQLGFSSKQERRGRRGAIHVFFLRSNVGSHFSGSCSLPHP